MVARPDPKTTRYLALVEASSSDGGQGCGLAAQSVIVIM
jgi:hypothetical protein